MRTRPPSLPGLWLIACCALVPSPAALAKDGGRAPEAGRNSAADSQAATAGTRLPRAATAYPLDDLARVLAPGEELPCRTGSVDLVDYAGERLKYQKPARIHPAFRAQLAAFEAIVNDLSIEHYGRAPRRIVHLGTYNCRVMRRYPSWVSEHALGNAIDIAGFDFGPVTRRMPAYAGAPAALRKSFSVRIDKHWHGQGTAAPHAAFLHALADALAARPDVFHVVLGPGYPGHHNHLHLDHAPYRVVDFSK